MAFNYLVYGLGISVNVPIAGLTGLRAPSQIDVHISLGSMPAFLADVSPEKCVEYYVSSDLEENGEPTCKIWLLFSGKYFRINYADGTVIVVNAGGSCIWAASANNATVEDMATYLLGPTLGFLLCFRGIICLHASAIAIDNKAVAFAGPSGHGKSTMAAALACMGFPVLTDDVLALKNDGDFFEAQPAYPRLRLWPQSVEALFGSKGALPRITPGWEKCFLDLNGSRYRFQHEPLPLAAIYFLDDRNELAKVPSISAMDAREGMMALVANTYATHLLDKAKRRNEFQELGRLAEKIPLKRISPIADWAKIDTACELIIEDFQCLRLET